MKSEVIYKIFLQYSFNFVSYLFEYKIKQNFVSSLLLIVNTGKTWEEKNFRFKASCPRGPNYKGRHTTCIP